MKHLLLVVLLIATLAAPAAAYTLNYNQNGKITGISDIEIGENRFDIEIRSGFIDYDPAVGFQTEQMSVIEQYYDKSWISSIDEANQLATEIFNEERRKLGEAGGTGLVTEQNHWQYVAYDYWMPGWYLYYYGDRGDYFYEDTNDFNLDPTWDPTVAFSNYASIISVVTPVPEPATVALLCAGMIGVVWRKKGFVNNS